MDNHFDHWVQAIVIRWCINAPISFSIAHSIARGKSDQSRFTEWHRKWLCQYEWTHQWKRCPFTKRTFQCSWSFRRWIHWYCGGDVQCNPSIANQSSLIDLWVQCDFSFYSQDDTHLNEEQNIRYSRPWTRRFRGQSPDSPSIITSHVRHSQSLPVTKVIHFLFDSLAGIDKWFD